MKSLESFKPLLRNGKIIPQGTHLLYETQSPFDQVLLPVESADFLVLCNGENSMSDIVERIYKSQGHVRFRTILRTLHFLNQRGFLENGEELSSLPNSTREAKLLSFKSVFQFQLAQKIFLHREYPLLFYILSMSVVIAAILAAKLYVPHFLSIEFIRMDGSYAKGLGITFLSASALLSAKAILKTLLLLFLTGRAYNFGFTFTGYALHYHVAQDSLFLVHNRLYLGLFHLASILSVLPIAALVAWQFDDFGFSPQILQIATLLFFLELNPFGEGEFNQLLRALFPDEMMQKVSAFMQNKSVLSLIHPTSPKHFHATLYVAFYLGILWGVSAVVVAFSVFSTHLPAIVHEASGRKWDSLSGLYLLTLFAIFGALASYNLFTLLSERSHKFFTHIYKNLLRHRSSEKLKNFDHEEVLRAIEDLPLFNYFPHELLNMLVQKSEISRYKAGAPVIVQGSEGRELFVLLSGHLEIQKRHGNYGFERLGEIFPQSIFGEVAVLEDCTRSADVVALEDSIVLSIPARALRQASEDNNYIHELEGFRNAIVVNQFFSSAPFFRDLDERIIQMFISKGKFESYTKGAPIFKQGDPGNGFYLLLRGHVSVAVNGHPVARISQGGFFGEISLIADISRTGTVVAQSPVQVLQISRDSFWEILSQDLHIALFIESIGEMRIVQDIELLKGSRSKIA